MEDGHSQEYQALVVPKTLVKQVKDALADHARFEKRLKIRPYSASLKYELIEGDPNSILDDTFCVPVTHACHGTSLSQLLQTVQMQEHATQISLVRMCLPDSVGHKIVSSQKNLLCRAIEKWYREAFCKDLNEGHQRSFQQASDSCSWGYVIYSPLLLLPATTFSVLSSILAQFDAPGASNSLYSSICEQLGISHIALNTPIPSTVTHKSDMIGNSVMSLQPESIAVSNILRSPCGFTPIHGDFGSELPSTHELTEEDFKSAFWCTTRQNGIFQTWPPRYVMFSRGNISEKARILNLPSPSQPTMTNTIQKRTAVDLYAGIGYFAFSYIKAAPAETKVMCWEINPWSIEALRRGARAMGWSSELMLHDEIFHSQSNEDERIIIFYESNERAAARISAVRNNIPPVTHVNCGYLPSSKDSWETAVQILDPGGGYVHAHENVAIADIEKRTEEIIQLFIKLVAACTEKESLEGWTIDCVYVMRVKSFAPGVMHCVFDIAIFPTNAASGSSALTDVRFERKK